MGFLKFISNLFGLNTRSVDVSISIQEQFETMKQLGFSLNDGIDATAMLKVCPTGNSVRGPLYHNLYIVLGECIDVEPWTPFTNQCWTFDIEAIEDHGSYVEIMTNISRLTNGELIFENLEDYVDVDEEIAWVSFSCRGDIYRWDLTVDNDWVDERLFVKVLELTEFYNTNGRFTYFNTYGQAFVLGFHTPDELNRIRQVTRLEIVWLKPKGQIY